VDLRISTLPTVHGEKIVMRILDKSSAILNLSKLGFTGLNLKRIEDNIHKPYGIILATGPTGSGKSTTLYAILGEISLPGVNVVTLEDPVEYEIPGINQCQIRPKIGFGFADGLRSILRQDPNIIMVGEIRDSETASLATHAALTGHLVLSTLHTNDAAGALPRLINMGVEPFLITSSINVIVAQRLVRRICDKCKQPKNIRETVLAGLKKEIDNSTNPELAIYKNKPLKFYEGKGCAECNGKGFKGRLGIYEVMTMSDKIEELVVKKMPSSSIQEEAVKEGMITMKQDGLIKSLQGLTTIDEVLRVTTS
jgi:type IV pilus assembly protein PilB